ncbi:tyrosine-type recombinase/integrase [Diaphorobacter caeni]|uniref:tyrosine-type recombinase/integrase n=1 Tax=Diaphorobacter caeni TaxID=2784387 RepID=UPI00188E5084|nr:phage integrase SAM-like domain-containing protein [Diaphorobacter caeni]MBF5006023.1 phage integrase SAM-like domain-containing protein [Diaphorobacter caeni]
MAYIGKFRDGWRAQIQRDGVRVSKTFALKKDAQSWALEQESKKTLRKDHTLGQACKKYLESVSVEKRGAVDWERRRFEAFCEHFGEGLNLSDITSEMIGKWRDARLKTVSGSTVQRETNLFRNMFNVAVSEWKWIAENPYKGVRMPKENPPRVEVWRWQQIKRILRAGQRTGGKTLEVTQAFHIALRTAMRLQEALAAPAGYNDARKIVKIPPSKTDPRPSDVPVTHQAARLLRKTPVLTVDANEASTLFAKLRKQQLITGLEFRDSRATALTLMARKMDILTLARVSRHKNLELLRSTYYRETADDIAARI